MKAKHHLILYTFLSFALIVAVLLSVNYGVRAAKASAALEDGYTQRVLETQEYLQSIALKLAKVQVAGDGRATVELMAEISRQADSVVTELSSLPLSHIAMSDTMKFCNQLSEYALTLALSASDGRSLTDDELTQLASLERQCNLLLGQFVTAREQMLRESIGMATEKSVYYQEVQLDQRPLEQVADSDNGMDYPTMIYDGAFSDARHYGTPKALGTETISAEQAVEIAVRFVGSDRAQSAAQSAQTEGTLAAFGVSVTLKDGLVLNVEVTKQGGKVLWIMPEHASFAQTLTLEECAEYARVFLNERGFADMQANHFQVYDGLAVINFVAMQDDAILYPDLVKLQIRMDTGEIVGMESNNYLMNHAKREKLQPTIAKEQALERVSTRLTVADTRLCVIPYRDTEKLCWEVIGSYQSSEYRVYISAETGEQVQLLKIIETPEGVVSA